MSELDVVVTRLIAGFSVNSVFVDAEVVGVAVAGAEAFTVFTFSVVYSAGVWLTVGVDLNVSVGVLRVCRSVDVD